MTRCPQSSASRRSRRFVSRANVTVERFTATARRLTDLSLAMVIPWRDGWPQWWLNDENRVGTDARDFGCNSGRGTAMGAHVNLFDVHNRICFPTEEQIADYPAEAKERFKAVRDAKAKLDAATEHRKSIEQQIVACDTERTATQVEMSKLRPNSSGEDGEYQKSHRIGATSAPTRTRTTELKFASAARPHARSAQRPGRRCHPPRVRATILKVGGFSPIPRRSTPERWDLLGDWPTLGQPFVGSVPWDDSTTFYSRSRRRSRRSRSTCAKVVCRYCGTTR